ncbi:hypothetical protein [Agrobacterium tumefaciens]|uniref:hypothetical protein n=1 Tax=Agrobacterium tumefaciens TaxID=358 RepID=UPI001572C545|nr:hypothetical protein [Agrobacterium tumefaciens]WCJ63919.1 hypothetical protein G6M15_06955 [Agrobacterium tumefaciens]
MIEYFVSAFSSWENFKSWLGNPVTALIVTTVVAIGLNLLFILYINPIFIRGSKVRYKKSILKRIKRLSQCVIHLENGSEHLVLFRLQNKFLAVIMLQILVVALLVAAQGKDYPIMPIIALMQALNSFMMTSVLMENSSYRTLFLTPRSVVKSLKAEVNEKKAELLNEDERRVLNVYLDRLSRQLPEMALVRQNKETHEAVEQFMRSHDQPNGRERLVERLSKANIGL